MGSFGDVECMISFLLACLLGMDDQRSCVDTYGDLSDCNESVARREGRKRSCSKCSVFSKNPAKRSLRVANRTRSHDLKSTHSPSAPIFCCPFPFPSPFSPSLPSLSTHVPPSLLHRTSLPPPHYPPAPPTTPTSSAAWPAVLPRRT